MEDISMAIVKTYTKSWAKAYKRESKALRSALSGIPKVKLYHIGSTAVKRAASRPVIDIMLTVADISLVTEEIMQGIGYTPASATAFSVGAAYEKAGEEVSYRVLVYSLADGKDITAHLDVKEYLIQNKKPRRAYSQKKMNHSGEDNYDEAMAEYKSELVSRVVKSATVMRSRTLYIPSLTFGGLLLGALIGIFAKGAFIGATIGVLSGFVVGAVLSAIMAKKGAK